MRVDFTVYLILCSILLLQTEGQENRPPRLPPSVLEEILRANNTGTGNNDMNALNMILQSLLPIMGSNPENSENIGSDNSTGVGILDFFRNMIAMFLRAILQVFKFFQLLSRAISGNDGKKLAFLSTNEMTSNLLDNQISDKSTEKLERVLRQIQTSAEEFPLNFFISDENAQQLEDQIKDAFKLLPNFENKSLEEILKTDSFKDNFKSGLKTIYRNKRQIMTKIDDNYNAINIPLNELLNQFIESHSQLNTDFHFEFPKSGE